MGMGAWDRRLGAGQPLGSDRRACGSGGCACPGPAAVIDDCNCVCACWRLLQLLICFGYMLSACCCRKKYDPGRGRVQGEKEKDPLVAVEHGEDDNDESRWRREFSHEDDDGSEDTSESEEESDSEDDGMLHGWTLVKCNGLYLIPYSLPGTCCRRHRSTAAQQEIHVQYWRRYEEETGSPKRPSQQRKQTQ